MARVVWSDQAKGNLRELVGWIAGRSVRDSEIWAERLLVAPDILEQFPEIGSPVEEFPETGLRELIIGSFRIVYSYRDDECLILAAVRAARDLRRVLDPDTLP